MVLPRLKFEVKSAVFVLGCSGVCSVARPVTEAVLRDSRQLANLCELLTVGSLVVLRQVTSVADPR